MSINNVDRLIRFEEPNVAHILQLKALESSAPNYRMWMNKVDRLIRFEGPKYAQIVLQLNALELSSPNYSFVHQLFDFNVGKT